MIILDCSDTHKFCTTLKYFVFHNDKTKISWATTFHLHKHFWRKPCRTSLRVTWKLKFVVEKNLYNCVWVGAASGDTLAIKISIIPHFKSSLSSTFHGSFTSSNVFQPMLHFSGHVCLHDGWYIYPWFVPVWFETYS